MRRKTKVKSGFNPYSPPYCSVFRPTEPSKQLTTSKDIMTYADGDTIQVEDLISNGITSIYVDHSSADQFDRYSSCTTRVILRKDTTIENRDYDKQMAKYQKDMLKYNEAMKAHGVRQAEWNKLKADWDKAQADKIAQDEFKLFTKLQKKYGKV